MVEQPEQAQFKTAKSRSFGMPDAIASAREEMSKISTLPIDSVIRCERSPDGHWTVALELIESPARMGDNDFLTAYELRIDPDGALLNLERLGRYRREDGGPV